MSGRVVAVAGAGGTLGPHVVRLLEGEGATVSAPDEHTYDLTDPAAAERWAGSLDRVDALVHLVGGWRGGFDWAFLEPLLVRTVLHTQRAFAPALAASGGRFVLVSSPQAERPGKDNAAYGAAKAAAEALTLAYAEELGEHGGAANIVRVKVISEKNVADVAAAVGFLLTGPGARMNGQVLPLHKP